MNTLFKTKDNTEPRLEVDNLVQFEQGVETMHSACAFAHDDIVRTACIPKDAELGRNDLATRVAAAAGFICGEGSISIATNGAGRGSKSMCLRLSVSNTDYTTIEFLRNVFGFGSVTKMPAKPPRRTYWVWTVAANKAFEVLKQIAPYMLSENKHKQALLGMEFQLKRQANHHSGVRLTEAEIAEQRLYAARMKELHWL